MKISILGAGHIGGSLGRLWLAAGHDIMFGTRRPGRLAGLIACASPAARSGTVTEAMSFADVVVDALPYAASMDLPAGSLAGRTLITASNYYPSRDGQIDLQELSQSEALANRLPDTHVIKAFNMLYFGEFTDRLQGGGNPGTAMLYAGGDPGARQIAARLIGDAGFVPFDAGPLENGRFFEAEAQLYGKSMGAAEVRRALDTLLLEQRPIARTG